MNDANRVCHSHDGFERGRAGAACRRIDPFLAYDGYSRGQSGTNVGEVIRQ